MTHQIYMELHSFSVAVIVVPCSISLIYLFHSQKELVPGNTTFHFKGCTSPSRIYLLFRQKSPLVFQLTPPVRVRVSSISPTRGSSSMYLKLTHIQVLSQYLRCDGQDHATWQQHDTRQQKGILNKWTVQLWWMPNCSQKAENLA